MHLTHNRRLNIAIIMALLKITLVQVQRSILVMALAVSFMSEMKHSLFILSMEVTFRWVELPALALFLFLSRLSYWTPGKSPLFFFLLGYIVIVIRKSVAWHTKRMSNDGFSNENYDTPQQREEQRWFFQEFNKRDKTESSPNKIFSLTFSTRNILMWYLKQKQDQTKVVRIREI